MTPKEKQLVDSSLNSLEAEMVKMIEALSQDPLFRSRLLVMIVKLLSFLVSEKIEATVVPYLRRVHRRTGASDFLSLGGDVDAEEAWAKSRPYIVGLHIDTFLRVGDKDLRIDIYRAPLVHWCDIRCEWRPYREIDNN